MRLVTVAFIASVAAFATLLIKSDLVVASPPVLKTFRELDQAARQLESAEVLLDEAASEKSERKRKLLLYQFSRESKSHVAENFWEETKKVGLEFKSKADLYVDDSRNTNQNWFTNIMKVVGNPMGAMKGMGRFDPILTEISERYEKQAKAKKPPTKEDVVCDVSRFRLKSLTAINLVLNTDVKQLIIGQRNVVNRAIFERLKSNRFITSTNFYSVHELKDAQKKLLLSYYQGKVDHETPISEMSDNVLHPSELVIGRLLESCQSLLKFSAEIEDELAENDTLCAESKSDPNGQLFSQQTRTSLDRDTPAFCQALMTSL